MSSLIVRPSGPLEGEIPISGAKNSVLKLMAATVLAEGTSVLRNVPEIADVRTSVVYEHLRNHGVAPA